MNAPCICPTCGQDLPDAPMEIRLADNTMAFGAETIHLQPQEAEFLTILQKAWPSIALYDSIMSGMYGGCDNAPYPKILAVYVTRIRQKIAPLGLKIETEWGRGYRLVYPEAA